MNLELSQKAGIWLSVAILVLIVGGYLGIYSGLKYLRDSSSQLATQKELHQRQSDRLEKLKDFKIKLDQAKEVIAVMNEALPVEEHRLSVISVLNNLASRSGAKLISITNETAGEEGFGEEAVTGESEGVETTGLAVQNLVVSVVGDYSKIKRFFTGLEQNRRPLNPTAFQISRNGAEIYLTHYYLR